MDVKYKVTTALLLSLSLSSSYGSECSPDQIKKNKINNFIILDQSPLVKTPKHIDMITDSTDDYIHSKNAVDFNACGELISSTSSLVKKTAGKNSTIISTQESTMRKTDYGLNALYTFNLSATDTTTQKNSVLFDVKGESLYTQNKQGVLDKSHDRATTSLPSGQKVVSVANTTYTLNSDNVLTHMSRKSTLANDSMDMAYKYDASNRLIEKKSEKDLYEYTYDAQGRELSMTQTTTYFTVEKTVITCKEWNEFGQCTLSNQHITETSKNKKTGDEIITTHDAISKMSYTY